MERTSVRLREDQKKLIEEQLDYKDSMGEWIREAVDQRLEEETEAQA